MGLRCDAPQASGLRNATSWDAQFGKRVASLMDTSHYAFASRWAHRVAESYRRSTHLTPAEQTAFEAHLRDPLIPRQHKRNSRPAPSETLPQSGDWPVGSDEREVWPARCQHRLECWRGHHGSAEPT